MMQSRMLAPMLGSAQLEYSPLCIYRDAIRRVSVSGGLCRSAQFFPAISNDAVAGEESYHSWSSTTSASSTAVDSSVRVSPVSLSFFDGDLFFSGPGNADPDGVQELRDIALQMIHDGYMKGLIRAFNGVSLSSAQQGGLFRSSDPDELLLRGWFSELDVEWVLQTGEEDGDMVLRLEDGCVSLQDLMERWIRALKTMVQVLCITQRELRATVPTVVGVRSAIRYFLTDFAGENKKKREHEILQFMRFAKASILRMLAFVDAVAIAALNDHQATETLPGMLQVYRCVMDDSGAILAMFKEASNTTSMFEDMNCIFLKKRKKLSDAIWGMMEKVRASFLTCDCWQFSREVEDVHKTTRLMMNYIMLLRRNDDALNFILQDHHFSVFVSEAEGFSLVVNLIVDTVSCLEQQLVDTSYSISDPGLRCIFLMNNFHFITQKVESLLLPSWTPTSEFRIQRYMETYVDLFWGTVMSCLYDGTHYGLRRYSSLARFELEFHKTYATQKFWKVPNPGLRQRLRKAIIEKVISSYRKYLTERTTRGSNTSPRNTPIELEELLEELFEG